MIIVSMDQDEILKRKAEEIEAIHAAALKQITDLQEKQNKIIEGFINDLKEKRLAELRQKIASQN